MLGPDYHLVVEPFQIALQHYNSHPNWYYTLEATIVTQWKCFGVSKRELNKSWFWSPKILTFMLWWSYERVQNFCKKYIINMLWHPLNARYTVLHIFTQVLFWAENQDNHQNLLSYKRWLIFIGMKQKHFFLEKMAKMADSKKTEIFNFPNSQYFFEKNSGIGPWVSRINGCERHQCNVA